MTAITKKAAHIAFATNLRNAMNRKGYSQAELVTRANSHSPKDHPISRSNIHEYCSGKKLPGPVRLEAIAKALGVELTDLVPLSTPRSRSLMAAGLSTSLEMIDVGNGQMRVVLDRTMPMAKAMEIMSVLNSIEKAQGRK